jgi:hypothetical protein
MSFDITWLSPAPKKAMLRVAKADGSQARLTIENSHTCCRPNSPICFENTSSIVIVRVCSLLAPSGVSFDKASFNPDITLVRT